MAVNLSPIGNGQQFFDNTGLPLNGGLIYTYQAGSSTALTTYTDVNGSIANSNPIVLDSSGRCATEIWLTYGYYYKFVVKTSAGITLGTYDNIYGIVGVQTAVGTTIPTGLISLWYGSIGSVPSGWYLCDGTNGTPDLRNRFIVGAGSTYSVGGTGGSTDAIVVSHSHTGTTDSTTITGSVDGASNATRFGNATGVFSTSNVTTKDVGTGSGSAAATLNLSAPHTHTLTTNTSGVSGTNANLPPYYALAYVMKA